MHDNTVMGGLLCIFCMTCMNSFVYAVNLFIIFLSAYCCLISIVSFFPCRFCHRHPTVGFFCISVLSSSRASIRVLPFASLLPRLLLSHPCNSYSPFHHSVICTNPWINVTFLTSTVFVTSCCHSSQSPNLVKKQLFMHQPHENTKTMER